MGTDGRREMRPRRVDGFAPIGEYAAIGDLRTVALVALDGAIDWLCLPQLDAPSSFGALLDPERGGRFVLQPAVDFSVSRTYVRDTNVLATTFMTADGVVRVTDALTLPQTGEPHSPQLVRTVEGVAGTVPMRWQVAPRFDAGRRRPLVERHDEALVLRDGPLALVLGAWDLGTPIVREDAVAGEAEVSEGDHGLLGLGAFAEEPWLRPSRERAERDLCATRERWEEVASRCAYDGPWRDAVLRSVLALQLLIGRETGAMAAAATTSLPERIGGDRNYDYRFAWLRDMDFALDALLAVGYEAEVHGSLRWALRAAATTHPRLRPFYRLDGTAGGEPRKLPLRGYRGSRPVRSGNGAGQQLQLGNYGTMLDTAWRYVASGSLLDPDSGTRLAELADFVCGAWRNEDSGIWELPDRRHYTHSKMACWQALDRATRLADAGAIPPRGRERWQEVAAEIRRYVDERCWSHEQQAFTQAAGHDALDAAVLLAPRIGFVEGDDPRLASTIRALRAELGAGGPLLYRSSELREREGAFVACSFWLAEALAYAGQADEAAEVIDAMLALRNDVGLLSEEIDPSEGSFRGNIPQALSHLSLIGAAQRVGERMTSRDRAAAA